MVPTIPFTRVNPIEDPEHKQNSQSSNVNDVTSDSINEVTPTPNDEEKTYFIFVKINSPPSSFDSPEKNFTNQ
jgi:hypothetical protein